MTPESDKESHSTRCRGRRWESSRYGKKTSSCDSKARDRDETLKICSCRIADRQGTRPDKNKNRQRQRQSNRRKGLEITHEEFNEVGRAVIESEYSAGAPLRTTVNTKVKTA
eukprot:scaffold481_cov102-Skeletonema_dohrnii-CCMP3373.AAC.4